MLAILALVLFAIAALFRLLSSHQSWVIPLMIAGGILVCCEVIWGWHSHGMYRRG